MASKEDQRCCRHLFFISYTIYTACGYRKHSQKQNFSFGFNPDQREKRQYKEGVVSSSYKLGQWPLCLSIALMVTTLLSVFFFP